MKLRLLLFLAQCSTLKASGAASKHVTADFYLNSTFSDPKYLKTSSPRKIHIGVSIKIIKNNNDNQTDFDDTFKKTVRILFQSLLRLSTGASQHWVILTDEASVASTNRILRNVITEHLTMNLLMTYLGRSRVRRVPNVVIDYIDLASVAKEPSCARFVAAVKAWANHYLLTDTKKYMDDLFYLGPLYHQIFPQLDKLIFLDADIEFYSDIKLLYRQFAKFGPGELLGVGRDLSPHYRSNLVNYRARNPGTKLGEAGRQQGLNTGVVLYDLARLRASTAWAAYLHHEEVFRLMAKYGFHVTLGDQDWLSNVSFENDTIFHILPCQFNAQVSVQYWRPPWEEIFWDYHGCEEPFHIIHRNGCGPERKWCDMALLQGGQTI